jgi:c-di-GMP-binding flagellar brake protein YcgR
LGKIKERIREAFSKLVLEWGVSPRYPVDLPVCFRISRLKRDRKSSRIIQGKAYDLSETGISILSPVITIDGLHAHFSNDTDTVLEIELALPHKAINIVGKTCRYQKVNSREFTYLLGIQFLRISQADKKLLEEYIDTIKRKPQEINHIIKPNFET